MSLATPVAERMRFGDFEADLGTGELFEAGRRIRLPNQSFIALGLLLEHAGQLVTREELRERVWPDNRVVEFEQGLNAVMNRLRDALRDSADNAKFIETLPRRGYRFIAPVEVIRAAKGSARPTSDAARPADNPVPPAADAASPAGIPVPPAVDAVVSPELAPVHVVEAERGRGRKPIRRIVLFAVAGIAVLLLGALSVYALRGQAVSEDASDRQVVPFTSLVGQEGAPTFSPDGSHIAFAWSAGSASRPQFDLYVKAIDSEHLLRLTRHPSNALSAAWSPDGTRIAFARQAEDSNGVFLVPALGGPERRLVAAGFGSEQFLQLSWSPDSKRLAYSVLNANGFHEVRLLAIDTLESQPVKAASGCFESGAPAFSPDGAQLAFMCMSSVAVYGIYVTDLPSGAPRLLASMLGDPRGLTWSADGDRIIVANEAGEGGALWSLTRRGQLSRLPFGEEAIGPGVAVRGDRLAYVHGTQVIDIWRVDLAAAEPVTRGSQLISSTRAQLLPQYSPDGTRIVFQSTRSGSPEIWLADASGSNPTRLTSFNGALTGAPVWCSDGRRIAFDSRASGTSAVYVMDIDERVPRPVKTTRDNLALPAWSEDCRWLFASDGRSALYRIPSAGGMAERVTERHSYYASVGGDRVIFNVTRATGVVLWSRSVEGGTEAPLEGMPALAYADSWTATRTGIYYFTRADNDAATLNFYNFADRSTRRLVTLPQAPTPLGGLGISLSRDGRWLLYTLSGESQSDIMLVQRRREPR